MADPEKRAINASSLMQASLKQTPEQVSRIARGHERTREEIRSLGPRAEQCHQSPPRRGATPAYSFLEFSKFTPLPRVQPCWIRKNYISQEATGRRGLPQSPSAPAVDSRSPLSWDLAWSRVFLSPASPCKDLTK